MADGKLECAFNKYHRILPHRMAKHLQQCKKNYPNLDMVVCPFNGIHYVPKDQLNQHTQTCEFRRSLERVIAPVGPAAAGPIVENLIVRDLPNAEYAEDWDNMPAVPSYLDVKDEVLKNQKILTYGELNRGKAAKREFRASEKERHLNLEQRKPE